MTCQTVLQCCLGLWAKQLRRVQHGCQRSHPTAALVVVHTDLALFSTACKGRSHLIQWIKSAPSGAYALVFQTVCIVTAISKQPVDLWQALEQCPCANVIADLPSGDEVVEQAAFAVADRAQLGVHATFGAPNQPALVHLRPCENRPSWGKPKRKLYVGGVG